MSEEAIIQTDVLVIGGGLAGTWAASAAAAAGASVVLADKGFCGTSGVTATAGPGHWWVPPDPQARWQAIEDRAALGEGLADPQWMARVLDETWRTLPSIGVHYAFPTDERGIVQYRNMRGPEYLRAMRRLVLRSGVRILDQSPALELIVDGSGTVVGARGVHRQENRRWTIRAAATVLATGGCAFMSRLLGCHTNTGDGALMAAEAGAVLSGMEFSAYYTVAPAHTTMTRSMSYAFATYFDEAGHEIAMPAGREATQALAQALQRGRVFCSLGRMPQDLRDRLTRIQPNVMLPFDRQRIDPFVDRFEVTLHAEGTIRGVGGLAIADDACGTTVDGLFAAGDVATREMVAGAVSGGGAQNSAWALSSGRWAGIAAAARARQRRGHADRPAQALGEAGLRPRRRARAMDRAGLIQAVQNEMLPTDKTLFRTGTALDQSSARLDSIWSDLRDHAGPHAPAEAARLREVAAMTAVARWCTGSALARAESRGMHRRLDCPVRDPNQLHHLRTGGLDRLWVRADGIAEPAERVA